MELFDANLFGTGKSNKRQSQGSIDVAPAAGANKAPERFDAAPNVVGRHKTKAELDAEAQAEARLTKAQSAFGSKE